MSMNIYAKPGTKVRYAGTSDEQINYVGATDPRSLLTEGQEYTIDYTDVCSSFTYVYLKEVDGKFNSCMFKDVKKEKPSLNVKDLVSGGQKVHFTCYSSGELWYITDSGFEFPVPTDDTGDGIFLAKDKAMFFMRYIRKHIDYINNAKNTEQNNNDVQVLSEPTVTVLKKVFPTIGHPIYITDDKYPGYIIEYHADGTQIFGNMVDGEFKAAND